MEPTQSYYTSNLRELKNCLAKSDPNFWPLLIKISETSKSFGQLFPLTRLRKLALDRGIPSSTHDSYTNNLKAINIGLIGGYSLYPFSELLEHLLFTNGFTPRLFIGDYDNFNSEILDGSSNLYSFMPNYVFIIPNNRFLGEISFSIGQNESLRKHASQQARHLIELATTVHERSKAEVILCNFIPPSGIDPGPIRAKTLASHWSYIRLLNLILGNEAPTFTHICDLDFLATRKGLLNITDPRGWFESKQPCSTDFLLDIAKEVVHIIKICKTSPKKVLVLDLDNTLWGGVIGDDGLNGIEIGDTSARGQAFKVFQQYLKTLAARGVLLAVCSKNDYQVAIEPFEKHPEMVLKKDDIIRFVANWEPKSDNIRQIANELNLGLDSFVFVDDNAAEIEIVRQFASEVTALHLGEDPSSFVNILQDSRVFEPLQYTSEDMEKLQQYREETNRRNLQTSCTDMNTYLKSLEMKAVVKKFIPADHPRITQLINKSNQFNLTTVRRTESEIKELSESPVHRCFTLRLEDKFGSYGLVGIVIGEIYDGSFYINTFIMSCRVLKRQVDNELFNLTCKYAIKSDCREVIGIYLPTAKNGMVKDFYPSLDFKKINHRGNNWPANTDFFVFDLKTFVPHQTHIELIEE